MQKDGKTILVTGGTDGIGKMSAHDCATEFVRAMESNADEANVGQVKLLKLVYSLSPALARRIILRF